MSFFPIDNRHFIAADDFCQINLSESQIESPFANGLAEGFGIAWISFYQGEVWPVRATNPM